MKKSKKKIILIITKIIFVCVLLYWLISQGKLDLAATRIFFDKPDVLFFNICLWLFGAVLIGSFRWYLLLKGIGLNPTYLRTVQLHLTGIFFNTALPGAVGGDLVKAIYIFKDQTEHSKSNALLSIFIDRMMGMYGLFSIGLVSIFLNLTFFLNSPILAPISLFVLAIFTAMSLLFAVMFLPYSEKRDPFFKFFSLNLPLFPIIIKLYLSFRSYRNAKKYVFVSYLLSITYQFVCLLFFLYLTNIFIKTDIPNSTFFGILPIGLLTTAIPLAPGGLGVGHAVFDKLYEMLGYAGGANIFNIVFLGQMCLNLLGFFPYLLLKSKKISTPLPKK